MARAEHPAERASFGFAGPPVDLRINRGATKGTLFVPLDPRAAEDIELASVALFRWDADRSRFDRVIPSRTRVAADSRDPDMAIAYVWGQVSEPGTYIPIGLPTDPGLQLTLGAFSIGQDLFPQFDPETLRGFQDRICGLILCAPDMAGVGGGGGTLCERCLGLDLSLDLPELDLLRHRSDGGLKFATFEPPCRYAAWRSAGPSIWHESPNVDLAGCSYDLAVDSDGGASSHLFTASANGGIWRRAVPIAAGSGWVPLTDFQPSLITTAVAVAPSDGTVVYYVDGLGYLYRSADRGQTWTRTSATTYSGVRRLLIDQADPLNIYLAASNQGLFHSTDGGATTALVLAGSIIDAALDPADGTIVYAAERAVGLKKSYDAGTNWQLVLPWATPNVQPGGSTMIKVSLGRGGTDANRTIAVKFGKPFSSIKAADARQEHLEAAPGTFAASPVTQVPATARATGHTASPSTPSTTT